MNTTFTTQHLNGQLDSPKLKPGDFIHISIVPNVDTYARPDQHTRIHTTVLQVVDGVAVEVNKVAPAT